MQSSFLVQWVCLCLRICVGKELTSRRRSRQRVLDVLVLQYLSQDRNRVLPSSVAAIFAQWKTDAAVDAVGRRPASTGRKGPRGLGANASELGPLGSDMLKPAPLAQVQAESPNACPAKHAGPRRRSYSRF